MNAASGTIVEQLQTQRTLLVDVVHQVEAAIKAFGGTITANGNGNGAVATVTKGSGSWWKNASPAKRARVTRKRLKTRAAKLEAFSSPLTQ